jgi:hypothetical protein
MILVTYFLIPSGGVRVGGRGGSYQYVQYNFVVLIAVAGMVGSAVSIFLRIQDFSETRIVNPPALFWTGFFKPIIGAAFALFVFVAFASGLLNVNSGVDQRFMFLTLGFIAGFSERFAPDLVGRLERSISAAAPKSPSHGPRAEVDRQPHDAPDPTGTDAVS